MEQKPRRKLHQARGEPHAFGGVSERGVAGKSLRFLPPWAVEISCGLLHERHPVAEQIGEGLRSREPLAERNGVLDRLLGHRPRLTLRTRFCFCATPGETGMIAQGPSPVQRPSNKAWRIVSGRPRGGETENGSRKGKYRPPDTGTGRRKKSRRMGG